MLGHLIYKLTNIDAPEFSVEIGEEQGLVCELKIKCCWDVTIVTFEDAIGLSRVVTSYPNHYRLHCGVCFQLLVKLITPRNLPCILQKSHHRRYYGPLSIDNFSLALTKHTPIETLRRGERKNSSRVASFPIYFLSPFPWVQDQRTSLK